jgi:hypothetical protein
MITVLCALPCNADAEPISFLYSVAAISFEKNGVYQPFAVTTFDLVATFDDQVTCAENGPGSGAESYGHVRARGIAIKAAPMP